MDPCPDLRIPIANLPVEGVTKSIVVQFADLDVDETPRIRTDTPLTASLHIAPVSGGVLATGTLKAVITCECDRCLKHYELSVATADVCHFLEGMQEPFIDLTEAVREDILIAFPQRCLCSPECRGLCPVCAHDLNTGACTCAGTDAANDTWQALDGLDLRAEPPE